MVIFFLIGFFCGFCSSAPLGPINLWIASAALSADSSDRKITPFITGVICVDVLFAWFATLGYKTFFSNTYLKNVVELGGSSFLILIGLFSLLKILKIDSSAPKAHIQKRDHTHRKDWLKTFSLGVLLCGSNPAFLLFWIFAINEASHMNAGIMTHTDIVFLLLGVVIGDAFWFKSLIAIILKLKTKVGQSLLIQIRLFIALAFISIGCYFMYTYGSQSF